VLVPLVLVAVLLPGCVDFTEPLSDPNKAEPDNRLLGKWVEISSPFGPVADNYEIDCPAVKGNPKGLMRAVEDRDADDPEKAIWFFTTKIGKDTYMTIYNNPGDFHKDGAFEKWNKGDDRGYIIVRYVMDGDRLTVEFGYEKEMKMLMQAEKIEKIEGVAFKTFKTPPGWLAKYLEKSGPQTLYNGANKFEYRQSKK
jgi:hypothetical protein